MNLPLPSAPASVAPATGRYDSVAASSARADDGSDSGAAFADMLAGAFLSAGSHCLQHPAGVNNSHPETDDQGPATQAPSGSMTKQADPARRARLKTDKSNGPNAAAQSNAGPVSLISPSATNAEHLQAPATNSPSPVECDIDSSPDETADSSSQQPTYPTDFQPVQWAPSGVLTAAEDADPRSGALEAGSATAVIDNPAATAIGGFTATDIDRKSGPQLGSTESPVQPFEPGRPQAASRHPADVTLPESANFNHGKPAAVSSGESSASVMESSQNWAEKIASPSMPPARKPEPDGAVAPPNAASDARLSSDSQQVKLHSLPVGIASAERDSEMRKLTDTSVPVRLDRASGLEVPASTAVSPALSGAPATASATRMIAKPASAPISHAAAAVEATLDAVEHMRDTAHSSVELKLSFGDDARLAVRVELRNGEVQTTFRTDSADLRQALTHEWRQQAPAVIATASDRPVRIADPVFAPDSGSLESAGTSTGGHANSRQPSTSAPAESPFSNFPRSQAQGAPASSAPSGPSRLPTSLRLNVFA